MVKSHIRQLMWNVKIGQKSLLITDSIRKFHNSGNNLIIDEQEKKCPNCDRVFTPYHQCWQMLLSVVLDCLIELHISEKKKKHVHIWNYVPRVSLAETSITKAETFNSGTDRRASRTRAFHNQTTEGAQLLSPGRQSIWHLKLGTDA